MVISRKELDFQQRQHLPFQEAGRGAAPSQFSLIILFSKKMCIVMEGSAELEHGLVGGEEVGTSSGTHSPSVPRLTGMMSRPLPETIEEKGQPG